MRKALIGLLLAATAAVPAAAFAQDGDRAEHYQRLEQRNQQRYEQRQQRQEQRVEQRQQRVEQPQPAPEQRQQRVEQRQQAWQGNRGERGGWRGGDAQAQQQAQQQQQQQQAQQQQAQQSWRDRSGQGRDRQGGNWQGRSSNGGSGPWVGDPNDPRSERYRQHYERVERQNQRDWQRDGRNDGRDWNRNGGNRDQWGRNDRRWDRQWRSDRRYDWSSYRNSYRDLFRLGRYYDPYGYGYRRFSIGIRIGEPFYSQRYWINDPWQYRLPDAGPGFAWVRYYNDVLLVDTWSGEVVDVIYDFFW